MHQINCGRYHHFHSLNFINNLKISKFSRSPIFLKSQSSYSVVRLANPDWMQAIIVDYSLELGTNNLNNLYLKLS